MPGPWSSGYSSGFGAGRQPRPKTFLVHVYDSAGDYIKTWPDVAIRPTFEWSINSGPQAMELQLPRAWGAAGELGESGSDGDLELGNQLKIYVVDRESGEDGVLIYQGEISRKSFDLSGQVTSVTLLPKTTYLQDVFVADALTFVAQDPTEMMQYFVENYMPGIAWDYGNPLVGATFSQVFRRQKLSQIFDLIRLLAGGTWFYRLNPDDTFTFDSWGLIPSADHRLVIGKHVGARVQFAKSNLEQKKRIRIIGGDGIEATAFAAGYEDPLDGDVNPRELVRVNDRITDGSTAIRIATSLLYFYDTTSIDSEAEVLDSNLSPGQGYDIETIRPGQVAQLTHPDNAFALPVVGEFTVGDGTYVGGPPNAGTQQPMPIVSLSYGYTSAGLKLAQRPQAVPSELVALSDRALLEETR